MSPAKPCSGSYSKETQDALVRNVDRAQWKPHPCAVCGQLVEGQYSSIGWIPSTHWPSINFGVTNRRDKTRLVRR